MELLLFLLFTGWCVTTTIINGDIFDPIRNYTLVRMPAISKLFTCIRCLGFWIGFIGFTLLTTFGVLGEVVPGVYPIFNIIIFPFIQSGTCILIESLVVFFHKNVSVTVNAEKSENSTSS